MKADFKNNQYIFGVLMSVISLGVVAAPLDDIGVEQRGDVVLATIKLSTPVHFLRYVPSDKSRVGEVYYERVPGSNASEAWVDREVRTSPATALTPAFTVTTSDQATQPKLLVEFASETDFSISPGADNRSFVITIKPAKGDVSAASNLPLPLLPTVVPPSDKLGSVEAAATTPENNQQAYKLMLEGRDALATKNYPAATEAFNKLLMLPPNQYTQDAQEWVGVARERGGQPAKAKVEYELYLKLFTTGPGVQRVKQRLAGLALPVAVAKMDMQTKKIEPRSFAQGGISSRYYNGQSSIDTTYTFNNATQTSNYTFTDQSTLITSADATQRYVSEQYDNRIVFRDVLTNNFLPGQSDRNRLNSAYVEVKDRTTDYSARLGRQSSSGGGVLGRFDGISAGYGSPQDFRVNAAAGQLVDFTAFTQPVFYGVSLDKGPVSVYLIEQTLEGFQDRRAVGSEFKYFDGGKTAYAMVDYDIYFNALNAATLNSTLGLETTGTTFSFVADYRKSPTMSTRNALNGAATTSVSSLLTVMNEAQLKQLAIDRTYNSAFSQFGVTQKLSQNWQIGGDIKLSQISGLPTSGIAPNLTTGVSALQGYIAATPATGLDKTITVQLIGSKLYSDNDITSVGSSYITSDYIQNGQSVYIYNRTAWDRELYFDTSWNYYSQSDSQGGSMSRNMPMVRMTYQVAERVSLDTDMGAELTTSSGSFQSSTTTRIFGSLGFRWDF